VETSLTLVKQVVNDDGGSAQASDWTLSASGPTSFSGPGPSVSSGDGFAAGTYTLAESGGPDGYAASAWDCAGAAVDGADTVTVTAGSQVTCTIVNDDIPVPTGINAGHSGAWYEQATDGQGIMVDVDQENRFIFLAWFTYTQADSEHPNEQHWLTAQGNFSGDTADLVLYESSGGKFDDPQSVTTLPVGSITLTFLSCTEAVMDYSFDAWDAQGTVELERVIPGSDDSCRELATQTLESVDINSGMDGAWFNPETSGQGFKVDAYPANNFMFVAWFTYSDDYASGLRWFTAQGPIEGDLATMKIYDTTGGVFDDPALPGRDEVGTMTMQFTDCGHATVFYSLPDAALEGEMSVIRVVPGTERVCESLQ
jgi:hypothetical protein